MADEELKYEKRPELFDYSPRDLGFHSEVKKQSNSKIDGLLLEAIFQTLLATDWAQTKYGARHPNSFVETNPILGKRPHKDTINGYMGGVGLAHAALAAGLPDPWDKIFQMLSIGVESDPVMGNKRIGVKARF